MNHQERLFQERHIGLTKTDINKMLDEIGASSFDDLINQVVPDGIQNEDPLTLPEAVSEREALAQLKAIGLSLIHI